MSIKELFKAIKESDDAKIEQMIQNGMNVNLQMENGTSGLLYACSLKDIKLVKLFLKHGADPNLAANSMATPLAIAVQTPTIVKLLLEKGANPNQVVNENGDAAVLHAVGANVIPSIVMLLKAGANPNQKNSTGTTPFVLGLQRHNIPICEIMLKEYGADPNLAFVGVSPLIYCCSQIEIPDSLIRLLISKGAHVNTVSKDETNTTALHQAVLHRRYNIVKILLEAGANVNLRDADGAKPLDYAQTNKMRGLLMIPHEPITEFVDVGAENSLLETIEEGNTLAVLNPDFHEQRLIVRKADGTLTSSWDYLLETQKNPVTREPIDMDAIQYKKAVIWSSVDGGNRSRPRTYKACKGRKGKSKSGRNRMRRHRL